MYGANANAQHFPTKLSITGNVSNWNNVPPENFLSAKTNEKIQQQQMLKLQPRQHDTHMQTENTHIMDPNNSQPFQYDYWLQTQKRPVPMYMLSNIERIQHKNMLIVLRQRNNISLWCNLQATTAAHLHIWTFKLANECCVTLEHGNVKPVSMTVTNKDVSCITNVDSIRVVGEVLAANAAQKLSFLAEYDDTVALHNQQH